MHVAAESSCAKFRFLFPVREGGVHGRMRRMGWGMLCSGWGQGWWPNVGGWEGDAHLSLSEAPMSLSDVSQVTNATDILFEAGDEQQLSSWTAKIRECVRRG